MKSKKALASVVLTTALVLAPAGVATAAPAHDAPAVVDVRHHDHDRGDRDKGDWRGDRKPDRHWDHRGDHHWRPNCFWFGPWLVCMPWR